MMFYVLFLFISGEKSIFLGRIGASVVNTIFAMVLCNFVSIKSEKGACAQLLTITCRPVRNTNSSFFIISAFFMFAYFDFRLCSMPSKYSSLDRTIHLSRNIADLSNWFCSMTPTNHPQLGSCIIQQCTCMRISR